MEEDGYIPHQDVVLDVEVKLESPRLILLHELWRGKCREGRLPARRDFDPPEMKEVLGAIFLTEYVPAQDDFRYTLIGTEIVKWVGVDNTGRFVGELFGDHGRSFYRLVRTARKPARIHGTVHWRDKRHVRFELLALPLADDGETVDRVIGATVYWLDSFD